MKVSVVGVPFCLGAKIQGTETAPSFMQSKFVSELSKLNISWENLILSSPQVINRQKDCLLEVSEMANKLALKVGSLISTNIKPIVFGGDHTIAIGTWSGVINSLNSHKNFGLIWIDAHMDSHTFESSYSKSYHGMPLSFLLGQGKSELSEIGSIRGKISPEHLVIIGARSYETEEKEFLEKNNVRIFYMEEVKSRGFKACFEDALSIVHAGKRNFGISIDLDYFNTDLAPGVGSPEADGGDLDSLTSTLGGILSNPHLAALEVVEYNPTLDTEDKTANLAFELIRSML